MREIKFRAWDTKNRQMSRPFTISSLTQYEHIFETMFTKLPIWKELIWLEYTGLKDKNGKEIYEGDILKGKYYSGKEHIQKVHWASYRWEGIDRYDASEVIGNIYENPELLEHGQGAGSSHSDSEIIK